MRARPRVLILIWFSVLLWLAAVPTQAAAQFDSTADALIGTLTEQLIVLAIAVAVIVEAALLFVIVRYRNRDEARPSGSNTRFLAAWVVAIGIILVFVGIASLQTMAALDGQGVDPPPDDAVQVDIVAEQWVWTFEYADLGVESRGTLVLPVNETAYLRITSRDVIHSFHVPELGVKQDANPAQWNSFTVTPTNADEYRAFCAEYCGVGHSRMLATVRVVDDAEFEAWVDEQSTNSTTT